MAPSPSSSYSSSGDTNASMISATCYCNHDAMPRFYHHHHQHQSNAIISTNHQSDNDVEAAYTQKGKIHKRNFPLFVLMISFLEIFVFVYDILRQQQLTANSKLSASSLPSDLIVATNSVFIYRPDRRLEVWRFISYMFLHANSLHLGFNVVTQLFFGIPLEIMHGSLRLIVIYFAGVLAGSLGTSIVDSEVYLVGASGGVYALMAANLANITLNYDQISNPMAKLLSLVIFVFCDMGFAIYSRFLASHSNTETYVPPISYIAHVTGALAGLTIGFLVLENYDDQTHKHLLWWLAFAIYCSFIVFAIIFNLINTVTAQRMEEQSEVIAQSLLHDFRVS